MVAAAAWSCPADSNRGAGTPVTDANGALKKNPPSLGIFNHICNDDSLITVHTAVEYNLICKQWIRLKMQNQLFKAKEDQSQNHTHTHTHTHWNMTHTLNLA